MQSNKQKTIESVCKMPSKFANYAQRKERLSQIIEKVKKHINKLTKTIGITGSYIVCAVQFDDCNDICFYVRDKETNEPPTDINKIHMGYAIADYPKWSNCLVLKIPLFLDDDGEYENGRNTFDQFDVIYQFECEISGNNM